MSIKWRVENMGIESKDPSGGYPSLEVNLKGFVNNPGDVMPTSIRSLGWEIERKLNVDPMEATRARYSAYDEVIRKQVMNYVYGMPNAYDIKNVIFNEPATIVFWADGTKTVVKCQEGDVFDPEKGLAMAFMKKVLGNKGHYFETIKKWVPEEYYEEPAEETRTIIGKVARVEVTPDGVNAYVDLHSSVDSKKLVDAIKGMEVKASMEMVCDKWTDHLKVVKDKPENPCDACEVLYGRVTENGVEPACYHTCAVRKDYVKSLKEGK